MEKLVINIPTPESLSIPHSSWRPHQYEACLWAEGIEDIGLMQAATGSGKSAIAAYLSRFKRAPVLTRTKSLQYQYEQYGAFIIMGRANYECIHPDNAGQYCDECLFAEEGMGRCPFSHRCIYLDKKSRSLRHHFPSANYALWLSSPAFRGKDWSGRDSLTATPIEHLVLDECHLLSDITLEWAGAIINEQDRREYELPPFFKIKSANLEGVEGALKWLESAQEQAHVNWVAMKKGSNANDPIIKNKLRKLERVGIKLLICKESLQHCPADWFIQSGPGVCYRRGPLPGIRIRPLTARYSFPRFFMGNYKALLMSATVGDFDTFAAELGIPLSDRHRVPSNFPPSTRPVYILDAPCLGHGSKEEAYQKQADVIADAIKMCPSSWSGIIHVTRKTEAPLLATRLSHRGLSGRLWTPPLKIGRRFAGTREQMDAWEQNKKIYPNSIAIAWQFWEGYDGTEEKICIVAKCPYPSTASLYEKNRRQYSAQFYNQRTAWALQQALGRTRRGREMDYDTEEEMRGFVAIADGNYSRIVSYLDDDFVEALTKI
jgi:Rad3-related DNA helicase